MKIGPKYKIARKLGAPVFEKTQTQKFILSQAKKAKIRTTRKHMSKITDYGLQMREKQKARYSYFLTEKQFSNYVKKALESRSKEKTDFLFGLLENRLDNAVFRMGLAPTRQASRQMVTHGHIKINERRVDIPSYQLSVGDKISIRNQSQTKGIFSGIDEKLKDFNVPKWIKFDSSKKEAEIVSKPSLEKTENLMFDLGIVLEFYNR